MDNVTYASCRYRVLFIKMSRGKRIYEGPGFPFASAFSMRITISVCLYPTQIPDVNLSPKYPFFIAINVLIAWLV